MFALRSDSLDHRRHTESLRLPGSAVAQPVTAEPPVINGIVLLHGDWLDVTLHAIAAAQRRRVQNGLPPGRAFSALAQAVAAAQQASGHADAANTPEAHDGVEPTVTVPEAAERLGLSDRQIRRIARRLGGKKTAGRWLMDDDAVREHEDGRT